ncbi:MAG: phage minor head protein [Desulfoplanes sp.]
MHSEQDIHSELQSFGPRIIDVLDSVDFFEMEGPYDPLETYQEVIIQPEYREYKKESVEKNSRVWGIIKGVLIGAAISSAITVNRQEYREPIKRYEAAHGPVGHSTKYYADKYIKEHGGEFIKGMSSTDQQKLVRFMWANSARNERPLAKDIAKQPHLQSILDTGRHRTATIIRTERHRASNYGATAHARDYGAKTKTRSEIGDKRTRPSHMALIGETVPIDKPYSNGEMYPGETSINCRGSQTFNF